MDINCNSPLTQTNGNPTTSGSINWAADDWQHPAAATACLRLRIMGRVGWRDWQCWLCSRWSDSPVDQATASGAIAGLLLRLLFCAVDDFTVHCSITTAATRTTTYTVTDFLGNSYVTGAAWGAIGSTAAAPTASKAVIKLSSKRWQYRRSTYHYGWRRQY